MENFIINKSLVASFYFALISRLLINWKGGMWMMILVVQDSPLLRSTHHPLKRRGKWTNVCLEFFGQFPMLLKSRFFLKYSLRAGSIISKRPNVKLHLSGKKGENCFIMENVISAAGAFPSDFSHKRKSRVHSNLILNYTMWYKISYSNNHGTFAALAELLDYLDSDLVAQFSYSVAFFAVDPCSIFLPHLPSEDEQIYWINLSL